jgi:hypothetical protein
MSVVLSHRPPGTVNTGVVVVLMIVGAAFEHWLLDVIGIHGRVQLWFLIPLSAFIGIAGPYRLRQYADLVEDCGDYLHVILRGRDFRFPLAQIHSVVITTLGTSRILVKLRIRKAAPAGAAIRFYAALPAERPTILADLEMLRDRIMGQ